MKGNPLSRELRKYSQVFVVCDRNVESFARQLAGLGAEEDTGGKLLCIDADEAHKTIETAVDICRWLLATGADRQALLLSVGGGITSDIAGFAACIYKRGICYANVPTTLLAMVDAGLGGKTGVNLDGYKNILGVIRQPEFTAIFPEVLASLPDREFLSGVAELLKTFVIGDADAYEAAVALIAGAREKAAAGSGIVAGADSGIAQKLLSDDADAAQLSALIHRAASIKQAIVEKDEFERGARRKLNLGHTWAHAIEWWQAGHQGIPAAAPAAPGMPASGQVLPAAYSHGEAVAIGLVQAARKAEELGITGKTPTVHGYDADFSLSSRLASDLSACGLPTELPCPEEELLPAIRKDKKAAGSAVAFVLPVRIGKVVVKKLVL